MRGSQLSWVSSAPSAPSPWSCYEFEAFEKLRKLVLTGGLVFMRPDTGAQVIFAILLCLRVMRVYAAYKPFIKDKIDIQSEASQSQLSFLILPVLAICVKLDIKKPPGQECVRFDNEHAPLSCVRGHGYKQSVECQGRQCDGKV